MTIDEIRERRRTAEFNILQAITKELRIFTDETGIVPASLTIGTRCLLRQVAGGLPYPVPHRLCVENVDLEVRL